MTFSAKPCHPVRLSSGWEWRDGALHNVALDIPLSELGALFTEENGEARLFIADTTHRKSGF